jgi:hypothetical protein
MMRTWLIIRHLVLAAGLLATSLASPSSTAAATPFTLAPGVNQFAVPGQSACAINSAHHLYCWGDNSWGQLGQRVSVKFSQNPRRVGTEKWRSIHGTNTGTICGIKWNYSVWCWGNNILLEPNDKDNTARFTPQLITTRPSISVERVHPNAGMCIRDRKQLLWCKLNPNNFFVGGWRLMSSAPVREASFVFDGQMCYLTTTNVMRCWGNNRHGVFATGPGTPVHVKNPRSAAGAFRSLMEYWVSCALGVDGYQKCWGRTHPYPGTVPDRVADAWLEENGVPCVDGLCVITPTKIEEIQWENLWGDQCGTLLGGEVSCLHKVMFASGSSVAVAVTLNQPYSDIKRGGSVGCGVMKDRSLWCWGLKDFRNDNVSGPRVFGRDVSDYSETPTQVLLP